LYSLHCSYHHSRLDIRRRWSSPPFNPNDGQCVDIELKWVLQRPRRLHSVPPSFSGWFKSLSSKIMQSHSQSVLDLFLIVVRCSVLTGTCPRPCSPPRPASCFLLGAFHFLNGSDCSHWTWIPCTLLSTTSTDVLPKEYQCELRETPYRRANYLIPSQINAACHLQGGGAWTSRYQSRPILSGCNNANQLDGPCVIKATRIGV
jgi:hypothetical protein